MSIYDIEVKDIDMNSIKMEEFKGKTLLIVNVASACGCLLYTSDAADD